MRDDGTCVSFDICEQNAASMTKPVHLEITNDSATTQAITTDTKDNKHVGTLVGNVTQSNLCVFFWQVFMIRGYVNISTMAKNVTKLVDGSFGYC